MKRICKQCGSELICLDRKEMFCPFCKQNININDSISDSSLKFRINQLKDMHDLMMLSNDEEIYATWIITGVPDEPSEDDFEWIARHDDEYNECFDLFVRLISDKDCRY